MMKPEFSKASFKAIKQPKLFFLPKKPQHKRDNSQPSTFEESPLKLSGPRIKHRRFRSCETHQEQVALMVRKEKLRDKIKQLASPMQKARKFRIKQKTDCHNQQYLNFLNRKKAAMDWIRFNITEGIYFLWNRIKDLGSIQRAKKIPEMEKLFRKSEEMVNLIQNVNKQYAESQKQEENRDCHKQQKDLDHGQVDHGQAQSIIKHSFQRSRQANNKQFRKIKNKTISFQNINRQYERSDAQALKEHFPEPNKKSVKKNSKIDKILQLIHSCNEDIIGLNRSLINISSEQIDISRTKQHLKYIKQLKNQLQSNQPALELIQDFIHKLQMLENSQGNISATLHNLKTIQEMMGQKVETESSYQKKSHELTSSMLMTFKSAFSACSKSIIKPSALSKKHLSRKNLTSSKKNQNGQTKKVRIAPANNCRVRASIELRIDSGDMPYNLYSTTVATPKNISIFKAKSKSKLASTAKQIDTNITSNNVSLAQSQAAIKMRKGNISKRQSDRQSKKKKSLAFQCTLQEELSQPKRKLSRKKTIKSNIKSRKQISFGSISCASFRSVRAIGSTKNISSKKNLSNASSNDLKQFHSFRNKREVQFIKGKLKKISLVRNYRSILFKFVKNLMGQEAAANQQQMKKEDIFKMFNITAEQLCQQNQDVQSEASIQPIEQKIQATKGRNKILSQTMPQFPTFLVSKQKNKTKPTGPPQRRQNRKKCLKEHPDEINNAVRQFVVKCKAIQHEGSISKKKQLLSNNIQHLRESKLISTQNYLKFKAVVHRTRRSDFKPDQPIEEETEESKRHFDHPYSCLLDLNKMIASNDTLSQTNNYYYRFSEFREHFNLVGRNIQEEDDQFFNIKTSIQQKQPIKRENMVEWRQKNHRDILLQKDY